MASYFNTEYKCKCGAEPTKIVFKKPSPYKAALISHECKDCGKKTLMRVYKVENEFKIQYKNLEV